jgi:hypothetical protein
MMFGELKAAKRGLDVDGNLDRQELATELPPGIVGDGVSSIEFL